MVGAKDVLSSPKIDAAIAKTSSDFAKDANDSSASNFMDLFGAQLQKNSDLKTGSNQTASSAGLKTAASGLNSKSGFDKSFLKKTEADVKTNDKTKTAESKISDKAKVSKKDDSKTGLKKTDSKSSDKTDKQDSKVDEAVEKIAGGLKESLGLTDDELETIMQQMGLSMNDLLNPAVLTQIFTQYKEVDQASLLTDQNLSDQLRDLLNLVNEAVEDASGAANDENYKLIDDLIANPAAEEDLSELKDMGQDKTDAKEELDLKETADQKSDFVETFAKKTSVEVKSDSNTSDSDSYMNQSQNAQVDDIPNQVYNMASSVASNFEEALDAISSDVNPVEVAKQVVEQAKVVVTKQMSSIEMVLNPESLGRVNLMVTMKQGTLTAQITAENEQVKKALETQLIQLKENFAEQGLKVDSVEVMVQAQAFSNSDPNAKNGDNSASDAKKASRRLSLNLDDDELEETADASQLTGSDTADNQSGSGVDFQA